jgi:hypothetical protein
LMPLSIRSFRLFIPASGSNKVEWLIS